MPNVIRILLAESHLMLSAGIRISLSEIEDLMLVGEVSDVGELLSLCQKCQPNVLLLSTTITDQPLTDQPLSETIQRVKQINPSLKVLVLMSGCDGDYARRLVDSGVSGCILKNECVKTLVDAIYAVARGELWFSLPLLKDIVRPTQHSSKLADWTARELDVLKLLGTGMTNQGIARALNVSERTISYDLARIYEKLGACSRTEASAQAIRLNLIE